jgi:hypothetical protein
VDFLPLGRIQFLVLLIGPMYTLRRRRRQIAPENDFFVFVVFLDKFMKYWYRYLDVYTVHTLFG